MLKAFSFALACLAFSGTALAFDGRSGAQSYDEHVCVARYYHQCVNTVCLNSSERHCKENICEKYSLRKCRYEDQYPNNSHDRLRIDQYQTRR